MMTGASVSPVGTLTTMKGRNTWAFLQYRIEFKLYFVILDRLVLLDGCLVTLPSSLLCDTWNFVSIDFNPACDIRLLAIAMNCLVFFVRSILGLFLSRLQAQSDAVCIALSRSLQVLLLLKRLLGLCVEIRVLRLMRTP